METNLIEPELRATLIVCLESAQWRLRWLSIEIAIQSLLLAAVAALVVLIANHPWAGLIIMLSAIPMLLCRGGLLESIHWWRMTRRYIFILQQTLNARTVSQLDFWTDQMGALKQP